MKKCIILTLTVLCSLAANAQVWVGGALGYENSKDEGNKNTTTTIAPTIGYELSEKWSVGLEFSMLSTDSETESPLSNGHVMHRNSKPKSFTVMPFVRYTYAQVGKVSFYIDGGVGYGQEKVSSTYSVEGPYASDYYAPNNGERKDTNFQISFRPGVKYAISDHLELESHLGNIGYSHTKSNYYSSNQWGCNLYNTMANLGMIWKF